MNNPVKTEVERMMKHQMDKGIERYGHGIQLNDGHDWLVEAIEECIDQLQYLVAAKLERDQKAFDNRMERTGNDPSRTRPVSIKQEMLQSGYIDTPDQGLVFIGGMTDTRVPKNHELHGLD